MYAWMDTDAYVGAWITIQKRARVTERHTANSNAEAAVLLLRGGLQAQHRAPESQTPQRLQNPTDALQEEARRQALHVQEMRQALRRQGRLENP
ncbi:UNVERIFIED_CONTAM: hypothetical protein Sradi_1094700 [Sesamum radiatum]|uniref:Uncharacterized protein n=1 Tax=Sesamum radiatum TaxID=300843 RepID=A0AAW2V7V1_SESRA